MARIRTVKPSFWTNEDLAGVSETAALLAVALLNYADDEGYFKSNPALVKAACFPIRETSVSVPVALQELSDIGYIVIGTGGDGKPVGLVANFDRHQRVSKPSPSTLKDGFEPNTQQFQERSVNPPGILPEPSGTEKEEEGNKEEEQEKEGGCGGKPSPEPEVVDDVGLVMQHVRAVLHPRMTREANEQYIAPRLRDGASVGQMVLVIDWKKAEWGHRDEMRRNLNPQTLFRKGHWERYLIEAEDWDAAGRPPVGSKNGSAGTTVAEKLAAIGGAA